MSGTAAKKEQHPMEALFGKTMLKNAKGETIDTQKAFAGKEIVALYFSASWCPPCKTFSPVLKQFYNNLSGQIFEIVYISSDRSVESFNEYYSTMPWLSLPAQGTADIKNALAGKFQIRGIPALIVLDVKTGYFLTDSARNDVSEIRNIESNKMSCLEVLTKWREKEAVPVEQAKFSGQGPGGVMGVIFYILKNPMYIFGLLYIFKQIMKKFNEKNGGPSIEDAGDDIPGMDAPDGPSYEDQEF